MAPEEKYNMLISKSECAIIISSTTEPKCSVKVLLTSPAMRDDADEEGDKKEEEKKKGTYSQFSLTLCFHLQILHTLQEP